MIQLKPRDGDYDARHWLSLKGTGIGEGETLKVNLGETVLAGRSRWCEWSLKRTPAYLKDENGTRQDLRASLSWRSVSRRHCRITYLSPDMVDVENLSANGTLVDGHRVDRILLTDCRTKPHLIQLGALGVTLELGPGSLPI
jgi:pSer/pThr/pTyr-binding forkhead associated (FHA) protein